MIGCGREKLQGQVMMMVMAMMMTMMKMMIMKTITMMISVLMTTTNTLKHNSKTQQSHIAFYHQDGAHTACLF